MLGKLPSRAILFSSWCEHTNLIVKSNLNSLREIYLPGCPPSLILYCYIKLWSLKGRKTRARILRDEVSLLFPFNNCSDSSWAQRERLDLFFQHKTTDPDRILMFLWASVDNIHSIFDHNLLTGCTHMEWYFGHKHYCSEPTYPWLYFLRMFQCINSVLHFEIFDQVRGNFTNMRGTGIIHTMWLGMEAVNRAFWSRLCSNPRHGNSASSCSSNNLVSPSNIL